MPMAYVTMYQP